MFRASKPTRIFSLFSPRLSEVSISVAIWTRNTRDRKDWLHTAELTTSAARSIPLTGTKSMTYLR